MDRFEKLIDLGLNTEEATLLTTPVREIDKVLATDSAWVHKHDLIAEQNKNFISNGGIHNVITNTFEPFQNPCDTRVIITSEHQRQDEMKKHGCFDAREMIPHGKTSLLEGQL